MLEVVCGAFIKNGKIMIAQRNYGSSAGKFEFPGGKVEPNETPEEALRREWMEECQVELKNIQLLSESYDNQEGMDIHLTCFVCTSDTIPDTPIVHSQFVWTTPEHIYDYDFFKADRDLVAQLKEKWECLKEQMK